MKNARDALQISMLDRQLYPICFYLFVEAYNDATKLTFGYLVLDSSPQSDDEYRTNLCPGEDPTVYTCLEQQSSPLM